MWKPAILFHSGILTLGHQVGGQRTPENQTMLVTWIDHGATRGLSLSYFEDCCIRVSKFDVFRAR